MSSFLLHRDSRFYHCFTKYFNFSPHPLWWTTGKVPTWLKSTIYLLYAHSREAEHWRERDRDRETQREKREGEESTHTTLLTELLQTYDHKSQKNTLAKPSISIFLNVESHLPTRWYDYFKLSFFPCNLCHCPLHDDLSSDTAGEKQGPHSTSSSKPLHLWP